MLVFHWSPLMKRAARDRGEAKICREAALSRCALYTGLRARIHKLRSSSPASNSKRSRPQPSRNMRIASLNGASYFFVCGQHGRASPCPKRTVVEDEHAVVGPRPSPLEQGVAGARIFVVQTLWAEKTRSTTDAGSLNTFGRNEIEVVPISSALLRIACLVILYETCRDEPVKIGRLRLLHDKPSHAGTHENRHDEAADNWPSGTTKVAARRTAMLRPKRPPWQPSPRAGGARDNAP
jgi:hypothetical protein